MGFGGDSATVDEGLRRLLGSRDQLVSVERLVRDEGPGRGAPVLVVRNPLGLSFEVLLDRALDIGWADAPGLPLAWQSARGPIESSRYEPDGLGWSRTFSGGLLTTCGLAATGAPSTVDGTHHGLHGRVGHLPADNVRWGVVKDGDERAVEVTGDIVEAGLGQSPLRLRRRIVASTVRPAVRIEDTVTNDGYSTAGHMFRHHINLGYPVVAAGTVVTATADPFGERDRPGVEPQALPWTLNLANNASEPETVVYCRPHPGPTAMVTVTAPDGAWVVVEQATDGWPLLILWRDPTPGMNVLGVEPSTSRDGGRAKAEEDNEVIRLEPGEARSYLTVVQAGRWPRFTRELLV